jgi:Zn-dependent M28 family amino/carboxypeptidase
MSSCLPLALVFGILAVAAEGHAPENDSIRMDHLKADLVFLAGDAVRGRLTETPENFEALAAAYWPASPPRIERYALQSRVEQVRIPVAQVSRSVAAELLQSANQPLVELSRSVESNGGAGAVAVDDVTVTLSLDVRRHIVPDRSVIAALEGSDPKLKDEWVVISSHHDHDGADGAVILNGADDNGSGTVGLIAIAEAYASAAGKGQRPRRSILFASFNSEERGLLGSWAFVASPPVPLAKIMAILNMDMVGRDEEVPEGGGLKFRGLPVQKAETNRDTFTLLGHSRSTALAESIERSNATGGFGLRIKKDYDNKDRK